MYKSEKIELQLLNTLEGIKNTSLRRAAILGVTKEENASTAIIIPHLAARYSIREQITTEILDDAQKAHLYSEIQNKTRLKRLYR